MLKLCAASNIIDSFTGEYAFLSNFFMSPMHVDNKVYKTVEHYYQASKCNSQADHEKIRMCNHPAQAKKLGRKVQCINNWNRVRLCVMRKALKQKFTRGELKELLINTHPFILVELNTWGDTYWGVCGSVGSNHLGKLLMELRAQFIKERYKEKQSCLPTSE